MADAIDRINDGTLNIFDINIRVSEDQRQKQAEKKDQQKQREIQKIMNMDAMEYEILLEDLVDIDFATAFNLIKGFLAFRYNSTKVNISEAAAGLYVPADNTINSLRDPRTKVVDDFYHMVGNDELSLNGSVYDLETRRVIYKTLLLFMLEQSAKCAEHERQFACIEVLRKYVKELEKENSKAKDPDDRAMTVQPN